MKMTRCNAKIHKIRASEQTDLSVRIQRVQHGGRRQEVPVSEVFSAALLEPQLLRLAEDPVAVPPAVGVGDILSLSPQCGAQRPDRGSDPEGRRLLDVLHRHRDTNGRALLRGEQTTSTPRS